MKAREALHWVLLGFVLAAALALLPWTTQAGVKAKSNKEDPTVPTNYLMDTQTTSEYASNVAAGSGAAVTFTDKICEIWVTVRESGGDTAGIELAFASGGQHIIVPSDGLLKIPLGANIAGAVLYFTDPDGGGDTDAVVTTWTCGTAVS